MIPIDNADNADKKERFLRAVAAELARAQAHYPPMASAHEAYAIILEEIEELWALIKVKQASHDHAAMYQEAVQAAAMLTRFAVDICVDVCGNDDEGEPA